MLSNLFQIINDIFFIPEKKVPYKEIFLDKTEYYKKEFNSFNLDKVFISCEYEWNLQKDLKNFKYKYNKSSYKGFITYYLRLYNHFSDNINKEEIIVTGTPMFFLNQIIRWYNPSYLLWKDFASKTDLIFEELVKKTKYTKKQAKCSKVDRKKNLRDCFKINSKYTLWLEWKTIILIDDVISTWNTLNRIAKILKENWAKNIIWLLLATWK
jgi:predicted amidophosphoribosyltransferase